VKLHDIARMGKISKETGSEKGWRRNYEIVVRYVSTTVGSGHVTT
jgi:hypothetical protein